MRVPTDPPPDSAAVASTAIARVNVRELRQNLSVYLERVKQGEVMEVAERGVPVAVLGPLPTHSVSPAIARLIAEGRLLPARHSPSDVGDALPARPGISLLAALDEQREDIV